MGRRIVATRRGTRPGRNGPSPFARLRGSATDRRMTTDEIMALTRGDIDE